MPQPIRKQSKRRRGLFYAPKHRRHLSRWWFYRPQWWFAGWSPISRGHDEYARRTLVIGWPITGQLVIATRPCGDPECEALVESDPEGRRHG